MQLNTPALPSVLLNPFGLPSTTHSSSYPPCFPRQQLPDKVAALILVISELGVRLANHQLNWCHDAQTTHLTVHGFRLSALPNHFRDGTRLFSHLTHHMQHLRSLKITQLSSFGPLSSLPPLLATQLQCLTLGFGGRHRSWVEPEALKYHLQGISCLVHLKVSWPRTMDTVI